MAQNNAGQVAIIIQSRHPLVKRIEQTQQCLRRLASALYSLDSQCSQLVRLGKPEITGRLAELDFSPFQPRIDAEIEVLNKLKRRFSRETLNIGVIGFARQGKSRLLRSISGLSSMVIPDGNRSDCTGVRSTIYHRPNVDEHGEVWFYTEGLFLNEVIAPYYRDLHLGTSPFSLAAFATEPLPPIPPDILGNAVPGAKYKYLQKYQSDLDQYKDLFYKTSPLRIDLKEVREYVAQVTPDNQPIYKYRAVQEVKISCTFPHEDVGQIALIDMPGLGDTGIGDQDRLIKTLGEDIDVALFIRMPSERGDSWDSDDTDLYDLVYKALMDLPVELWSFMVLNRTRNNPQKNIADNLVNCGDLEKTIFSKGHISVVKCLIADCSEPEEVRDIVLQEILNYLVKNIAALDKRYAEACQERVLSLQKEVQTMLREAQQALGEATASKEKSRLFRMLFKELWGDLTEGLEGLVRKLGEKPNAEDSIYQKYLEAAFQACENDMIPSLEEIERRRDRVGGYDRAYSQFLDEVRTRLTHHFISLDDALKLSIEEVKKQAAEVLINGGRLGDLMVTRENAQSLYAKDLLNEAIVGETAASRGGTEFLTAIERLIPNDLQSLKQPFQILASFELSYRGFIQYRIRRNLNGLIPDSTPRQLSSTPSAKEVQSYLKGLHDQTVFELQEEFRESRFDTSQVAFAIAEEFKDQLLRSKDVEDDWMLFYEEMSISVWPEDFRELGEKSYIRRQWQDGIDQALQANQTDCFQFLS